MRKRTKLTLVCLATMMLPYRIEYLVAVLVLTAITTEHIGDDPLNFLLAQWNFLTLMKFFFRKFEFPDNWWMGITWMRRRA
jgi:hypothetical protein